jgi:hypothetical protein
LNVTGFYLGAGDIDKIDTLKNKRGTSRSETLRYIINEFFDSESMGLIDELERIKHQNRDLEYRLKKMMKTMSEQHGQVLALLLLLGGSDELFKKEVRKRFPQFWEKK